MTKQNTNKTFEDEELIWPEIKPDWDAATLLSQRGMFKFAKIKKILNMSTIELTKLKKKCRAEGTDCYRTYGFAKPHGSQYIVRMSIFRDTFKSLAIDKVKITRLREVDILNVPQGIQNANQLTDLEGCYRFSEICRFSPFKEHCEVIKTHIRRATDQEQAMDQMGAWYDRTRREYFVKMEVFHLWFLNTVWPNAK